MTPSLKTAQRELSCRLQSIDDWHAIALANLSDGHGWQDIDALECTRCDMALAAHNDFKASEAEWDAYVLAHADDEA